LMRPEDLSGEARDAYRMWHDFFGLSEESALRAVADDGLIETSEFDRAAATFSNIFGLSAAAARVAARGRMRASEGQRFWGSSAEESERGGDVFAAAQEALNRMSDSEIDAMLVEVQGRREAAKKAPPNGAVGEKHPTVVSEWNRLK
jgi:hypothetical protein